MKVSEEQLKEWQQRIARTSELATRVVMTHPANQGYITNLSAEPRRKGMNKTEAAYSRILQARLVAGEIKRWDYERVTLHLGFDLRYTPDFRVVLADDSVEFHETKGGFIRDDAKVKLKAAATAFPEWRFYLAVLRKTEWTVTRVATI